MRRQCNFRLKTRGSSIFVDEECHIPNDGNTTQARDSSTKFFAHRIAITENLFFFGTA